MKLRKSALTALLALGLVPALQGCFPVVVGGAGMAVAVAVDRRSSGTYMDDESIEWKALNRINGELGDKVHLNTRPTTASCS